MLGSVPSTRILVLWQSMSGYFNSSLKALSASGEVELALAYRAASQQAPFRDEQFSWVPSQYCWQHEPNVEQVMRLADRLQPHAVLVSSWHIRGYRAALARLGQPDIARVLCMDNQWHGTPKQWLGRLTWRAYIRPYYDQVFVPGDRQAFFARRLGFRAEHIWRGLYCADTPAFTRPVEERALRSRRFLYVGRLADEKGIDLLATAYACYRMTVRDPWPLRVVGTGPAADVIRRVPGVEMAGFVQPDRLPALMWDATSIICPSRFEPWGVVVHEATAAGLIVVCSEAVGAGAHLVQDGLNGYVVPTGRTEDLISALHAVAATPDTRLEQMASASVALSQQFSPERWASYLLKMLWWGRSSAAVASGRPRDRHLRNRT